MDELVKRVSEKTGLSEEMAETVVEFVLDYLKTKLPEPIAGQIDHIMGGTEIGAEAGGLIKGLKGFFGKK